MRKFYAVLILVTVFGGISYGFQSRNNGIDTTKQVADATDEYVYRKLSNGAIVYEPAATGPIEDIEPAAGGEAASDAFPHATFKYDPLTQTYRRTMVDSRGNSSQDIIRDPANP